MSGEYVGRIITTKSAQGDRLGTGEVYAYSGAPVYHYCDENGNRGTWRHDLCELASPEEELDYWRARAKAAERKLEDADSG